MPFNDPNVIFLFTNFYSWISRFFLGYSSILYPVPASLWCRFCWLRGSSSAQNIQPRASSSVFINHLNVFNSPVAASPLFLLVIWRTVICITAILYKILINVIFSSWLYSHRKKRTKEEGIEEVQKKKKQKLDHFVKEGFFYSVYCSRAFFFLFFYLHEI